MNEDSVIPPLVSGFEPFDRPGLSPNRWQDQLLPVNTVLAEEDVTVLRQEVETAHQLLQYQQRLIDSLTEQLVGNEAHRTQLEQDLAEVQRHTNKEAAQLKEFQSICKDLRSQIRKQQARICEFKTVLKQNSNTLLPNDKVSRRFVSFGYTSVAVDGFASSSSPVSPWSATDPVNLTNAFAICCRKLAALGLEHSSEVEGQEISSPQKILSPQVVATPNNQSSSPSPLANVELPSFVK